MSAEEDLYTALSGAAAVSAIVGTKITPDVVTEDSPPPTLVYQRAGTEPLSTIHGTTIGETASMRVIAYSRTRAEAESLANAAKTAALAAKFTLEDRGSDYVPDLDLYSVNLLFSYFTTS